MSAQCAASICTSIVATNPNFNANVYATMVEKKCDTKTVIDITANRSVAQRIEIAESYRLLHQKDLRNKFKNEMSGHFANTAIALMTPLPELYAIELHEAIMEVNVNKSTIIEILCTLSNLGVQTVVENYKSLYKHNIEMDLMSVTTGYFQKLCTSLSSATRDRTTVINENDVLKDAQTLYKTGKNGSRKNELIFIDIFTRRSFQHLRSVFSAYRRMGEMEIEEFISSALSNEVSTALLFLVKCIKSKVKFFAKRLHQSMVGLKTDDKTIIRIIVARSEIDLRDIKEAFFQLYGTDLSSWITTTTSGDYQQLLLKIVG